MSHLVMTCHLLLYDCFRSCTQWHRRTFQGSGPKVRPLTNIFAKKTMVWASGSIILIPPLAKGNIAMSHATFALAFPFAWPDQTKFFIKLFIVFTIESDKSAHEGTYHIDARITWFATKILATIVNFLDIHITSFPLIDCRTLLSFSFCGIL